MTLLARQRRKYETFCPDALEHYDRIFDLGPEPNDTWNRAGGGVECEECGQQYYDHPPHPYYPALTIVCSGEFVKL